MSSPFLSAFEEQKSLQASYKEPAGAQQMDVAQSEQKGDLKIVKYREEEAIFIQASHDRVTIIFSTVFKEETDRVYGRVFLQVRPDRRLLGVGLTVIGVRGCETAAKLAECPAGHVLESRTASGDPSPARPEER
jgi:actin related protein 2/3 complex subunit 2